MIAKSHVLPGQAHARRLPHGDKSEIGRRTTKENISSAEIPSHSVLNADSVCRAGSAEYKHMQRNMSINQFIRLLLRLCLSRR